MTSITGVHPYADKFPMLPEMELEELAESIAANGLRQPIVLDSEGRILDGRNRFEACSRAGVTPVTVIYEGDDLAEYVLDSNINRRNMSTGARAMATALVLEADGRRENGRWKRGSVDIGGTANISGWQARLKEAGIVLDYQPSLAEQVITGQLALDAAYQQAKAIRDSAEADKIRERELAKAKRESERREAEQRARMLADLTAAESSYLPLVEAGQMSVQAAYAAWREDTRREREEADAAKHNRETLYRALRRALETLSDPSIVTRIPKEIQPYRAELDQTTVPITPQLVQAAVTNLNKIKDML